MQRQQSSLIFHSSFPQQTHASAHPHNLPNPHTQHRTGHELHRLNRESLDEAAAQSNALGVEAVLLNFPAEKEKRLLLFLRLLRFHHLNHAYTHPLRFSEASLV